MNEKRIAYFSRLYDGTLGSPPVFSAIEPTTENLAKLRAEGHCPDHAEPEFGAARCYHIAITRTSGNDQ